MGNSKFHDFLYGLRLGLPVVFGYIPVAIAYGIMARKAGMSIAQTTVASLTVFAGASQIMAAGMIAEGASVVAIVIATFLLNLRHLIMSTCIFDRMKPGKNPLKYLAAFVATDEAFGIYTNHPKVLTIFTFLGHALIGWAAWVLGSLLGAAVGDLLPKIITASFGVALYAMFISMLMPNCRRSLRITLLVLMTACCNILLNQFLASHWSLIISTLLCAFIGVFFVDPDDKGWKLKKEKKEEPENKEVTENVR